MNRAPDSTPRERDCAAPDGPGRRRVGAPSVRRPAGGAAMPTPTGRRGRPCGADDGAPRSLPPRRLHLASLALLAGLLGACAVATPLPRLADPSIAADRQADQPVVLVLTRVVVDPERRAEFDRQNRRVLASMGQQPGLLGHAVRKQLFGNEAWTLSAWANDEARAAFMRSAVHQEAIAKSMPALVSVELKRLTLPRKDLPRDWDAVLRLLDEPEGRRGYWE